MIGLVDLPLPPIVIVGLAFVLPVTALQVFFFAKTLKNADSPNRPKLSRSTQFKCGVWGLSPGPIYTSYPLATLLIAEEIVGVRTPMLGTFLIRKDADAVIAESSTLFRKALVLRSERRRLRVVVSSKDWPTICEHLTAMSWNVQLRPPI